MTLSLKSVALIALGTSAPIMCTSAGASTLKTAVIAGYELQPGGYEGSTIREEFDNSSADARSDIATDLVEPSGTGDGGASIIADVATGKFELNTAATKNPGTGKSGHIGRTFFEAEYAFTAVGDTTVTAALDFDGAFGVLTDRFDVGRLRTLRRSMDIIAPGFSYAASRSITENDDPLSGLANGSFSERYETTFDVADGQGFDIYILFVTRSGDGIAIAEGTVLREEFYDAWTSIFGELTLDVEGGALTPEESDVTPIPLPAGFPLLLSGLGAVLFASRRKSRVSRKTRANKKGFA